MQAYSVPMTPPPTTIMVLGSCLSRKSVSEQNDVCSSSNGTFAGRAGRDPVAITNTSALIRSPSSGRVDLDQVGRNEPGLAPDQLDVVAVEVAADHVELVADDLLADEDQVGRS